MSVADHLLECADPAASARVSKSPQFSHAELRDAAARVKDGYLLHIYATEIPESVLDALHGYKAAFDAATRQLKSQFQFLLIGQPTTRRGSAWRT